MTAVPALIGVQIFLIIIKKITFKLMRRNKAASSRLVINNQLRLFYLQQRQRLLIVIFFRLVFRVFVYEYTCGRSLAGPRP